MKKDYEEYRDTGVLGGYHPEMAVLQEQRGGEILTTFRDTNYQQRGITWRASGRCSSGGRYSM